MVGLNSITVIITLDVKDQYTPIKRDCQNGFWKNIVGLKKHPTRSNNILRYIVYRYIYTYTHTHKI